MSKIYPDVEELIPHRKPILCIDKVLSVAGIDARTSYKVNDTHLFYNQTGFSELGLLENAAQTSFVFLKFFFADYKEDLWSEDKDSVGFISHITDLQCYYMPQKNEIILTETQTELVFDSENLKICNVKAETKSEENLIFQAEMKLILQTRDL